MNVADLLTRQSLATPHATAVIQGDREFSYASFEAMVWGLCRHLRDCGLRPGDVVGLQLNDPLLHLAAVLALARSGMTSVAITAEGADTPAGRSILTRTGAAAVIDGDRRVDWGLLTRIQLDLDGVRALAADPDETIRCDQPDRLLHYKTSSGTTGAPKIVAARHAGMMASIARETACIGYPAGERYLTPVSLVFDGPRRRYLACLASGATAVMPPGDGSPAALIDTIDRHDVRHFSCVPVQACELAAAVAPGRQRFPRMRCLRLSAGPSDASLQRLLRERLSANVLVSYGCTELGPLTVATPDLVASRPQTVGHPMPGIELQIVSADDRLLPPGAVGLIRVRAQGMPHAYHDDPEATAKFFRNGWFYPGDLGKTDEEGLLFHMGRSDGMMIMNGINIHPAGIEQVMLSQPAVRDAAAMPLKHRVTNDVPVCAVVSNDGERVSEQELLVFARGRLGSHSTRQLSLPAAVSFSLPPRLDLEQLDAWLCGVLHIDVPDMPGAEGLPQRGPEQSARAWVQRVLLLTRLLLQAARIPVFDAPQLSACFAGPSGSDTWHAHVSFARVEEMPHVAYDIAYQGALHLCAWATANAVDARNLQAFYALAQQRVASDLGSMMPPGKSTLPVLRAAHRKSIPFTHLGAGVFQLGWGCRAQRMDRSVTGRDAAIGARLCANKALTATLLRKAGLPAPVHKVVTNLQAALQAAHQIGWPVVVKPVDRERGEGVVVDVGDDDQLKAAFRSTSALSRTKAVIVERQVDGVCHRLFMAHGRLLYAVKRLPMSIEGDGVADVAGLIDAELARQLRLPPWDRSGIQPLDELARAAIVRAGYTPTSIPARGALVPLRRIESTEWGGVDEEVTQQIHPENLGIALTASELFGLGMAGIDIITADITRPWFENGAIVNEVNFAPLLGGGDISRSYIPTFLDEFVDGTGTIPVEVFVGGEAAWAAATRRWQEIVAPGLDAYLSHAHQTLAPPGQEWRMPFVGLYPRTRALVLSTRVQALVLVVQTDEFLTTGLPLEAVSAVTVIDERLSSSSSKGEPLPRERLDALLQVLRRWRGSPAVAAPVKVE
ncbi:MAG: AMP-binding protein [Rubrivivax sp.]|nr:AMP-binding protein [Rubrivivax sp.]